ncbi:MAG: hypothetical protein JXN59_02445, partial [Anaerolineae bacterium]|nr:hypothetical protein [Anaerolineae bacterium]
MPMRVNTPFAVFLALLLAFTLAGSAAAQGGSTALQGSARTLDVLQEIDIPVRDAIALAERLGGLAGASAISIPPAPDYAVGDVKTFFVGHNDRDEVFEVEAVLAAEAPGVYLWVERGMAYDALILEQLATFLDDQLFPAVRELYGQEANPGI